MDDRRATYNGDQLGPVQDPSGRRVFAAVMMQAVRDAVNYGDDAVKNPAGTGGSLSWFDGRDCRFFCYSLDLDHGSLRAGVHELREAMLARRSDAKRAAWDDLIAEKIRGATR